MAPKFMKFKNYFCYKKLTGGGGEEDNFDERDGRVQYRYIVYSTVGTRGITRTLHNLKNANRQGKYQYTVRTVWRMSLSSK